MLIKKMENLKKTLEDVLEFRDKIIDIIRKEIDGVTKSDEKLKMK